MALLTGQNVCDEVAWRIQNRIAANSSGAGSLISMTNDALGLISAAGSWVWDMTYSTNLNLTSISLQFGVQPPDFGKKITLLNTATQTPIVRITQDDAGAAGAGYANVSGTDANAFMTYITFGNPQLIIVPNVAATMDIYYHQLPPTLVYGASPTVRWSISEMDALLKDWTTAFAMKWCGLSGWDTTWADCIGRVGTLARMYTTERINTGPESETTAAVGEKNALGRA